MASRNGGNDSRGRWLVIAMTGVAIVLAIIASKYSTWLTPRPLSQPAPPATAATAPDQ